MDHDVPFADFPSCATVSVRATYLRRIHVFCGVFFPIHRVQTNALLFPFTGTPIHQLVESYQIRSSSALCQNNWVSTEFGAG